MPGLHRKKCKACQHGNQFNFKKCGVVLDIQSPDRPRGTTANEGYGVSAVHVGHVSSGQEAVC